MIKPLLVNDTERVGGAAIAANRLHHGLLATGIASQYLVMEKTSSDSTVLGPVSSLGRMFARMKLRSILEILPLFFYKQRKAFPYSGSFFPSCTVDRISEVTANIIHLHWVTGGMLRIESFSKLNKPLLWTLHDSWAFTGGCHIPFECEGYQTGCGNCPTLESHRSCDLSSWVMKRKVKHWKNLDLTLVAPSRWMADAASKSLLFRDKKIHVIPNGLDSEIFKPLDKTFCRKALNIALNKKIILFGALCSVSDQNKGFDLLIDGLKHFTQEFEQHDVEFVVFGALKPDDYPDLGVATHFMGTFHDETSLALLYSAADVMVVPSRQESFGQTASEAMACGCPVVAFATSGLLDIVDHKKNGYLARAYDVQKLAYGIHWILSCPERYQKLSMAAREKAVNKFDYKVVAKQYVKLYKDIVGATE